MKNEGVIKVVGVRCFVGVFWNCSSFVFLFGNRMLRV